MCRGGLMLSAGLTAFLNGITGANRISFLLWCNLVLCGIHVLLAGYIILSNALLGVKIGMTFSGGFIDYILYGLLN